MAVSLVGSPKSDQAVPTLDATHRCDKCGAQAYVRVVLTTALDLLFCAHHYAENKTGLDPLTDDLVDERDRLVQNKLQGSEN